MYLGIYLILAVQLHTHTHTLHSLPTITRCLPEVLVMNKQTTKMLPCPEPVQSSPILPSDSTVPRSGTSQSNASCPRSLLLNPDVLSDQPNKPVMNTGVHFQYKLHIWSQEL